MSRKHLQGPGTGLNFAPLNLDFSKMLGGALLGAVGGYFLAPKSVQYPVAALGGVLGMIMGRQMDARARDIARAQKLVQANVDTGAPPVLPMEIEQASDKEATEVVKGLMAEEAQIDRLENRRRLLVRRTR